MTRLPTSMTGSTIALIGLLASWSAFGFEQTSMRFERVTMEQGLSQSSVFSIAQDKTGFMWFATENGLDRYDGISFRNYRRESGNDASLTANFARDFDADGSLWVGTDGGGVSRWDPHSNSFNSWRHDPQNSSSLANDRIRTILTDRRGYVWIGTRDAGLDRLNTETGQVTHYSHAPNDSNSISNNEIYALALANDGTLWIGTKAGLSTLNVETGNITRYQANAENGSGLVDDQIRSLLIDEQETLWVGTRSAGLARFDAQAGTFHHYRHDADAFHSISSDRVETIFEDMDGRLWIGTDRGLNMLNRDSGSFINFRNDPTSDSSLSDDFIWTIFQDRSGILWVGTRTGGVNRWNPRSWSFGHFEPSVNVDAHFSNPNVSSFTEDQSGKLWVGTFGGGLNVMDRSNDTITQLRHDPDVPGSLSDDRVMAMLSDSEGRVWAGTMAGGLNRIDTTSGKIRTYRHDPADNTSLAADGVMSLLQDRAGAMWIGTFGGGVSRLDPGSDQFVNYPHDPENDQSLSSPRATSIAQDHDGVIWVGTDGGGLNRLDQASGQWQHFVHNDDDPSSLAANTIYALHVDRSGTLWVGTRSGLNKLTGSGLTSSFVRSGDVLALEELMNNAVYSIQSSKNGDLWLGTSRGLVRFNPGSGHVRSFHESQGLQGEEFNFGASYSNAAGELFFGGSNGFNAFHPDELEFSQKPPAVVLTSLSVLNEPLKSDRPYELIDRVELGYRDDVVTFGISALDYTDPLANSYSYQLDGFDDAWVDAGQQRRITYTNLDGGDYTLRVRAANADGIWNYAGISMPIRVAFPPWQTWWAYTLYAIAILGATLGFVRYQQQKLQREAEYSRRLEDEVRQRTEELKRRNVDLNEVNAKLLQASTTDPLTGLRNRRYLFEQVNKDVDLVLRHYRDGTETMAPGGNNDLLFLMVDLDNFKPVNDSCGHEAGDELLCQIRDVLLEACRSSDDVIRWGGDEFLIVARDTNRNYAAILADRIRCNLAQRVFPVGNGQVARTTASIGYASFPFIKDQPDLLHWEDVLGVADAAMYEAKQKRNSWLGIEGIDWDGTSDELCSAIKMNPGKLADEGLIVAIESLEEAEKNVG